MPSPWSSITRCPGFQTREHIGFHHLHLFDVREQGLARRGGAHTFTAHQQTLTQTVFQGLDANRDRGQGQGQRLRGRTKTTVFDDGAEGFELTGVEHVRYLVEL